MDVIMIQRFCDHYKISHYALDVTKKLFHKSVVRSSYPALMYYMIGETHAPSHRQEDQRSYYKGTQHTQNSSNDRQQLVTEGVEQNGRKDETTLL